MFIRSPCMNNENERKYMKMNVESSEPWQYFFGDQGEGNSHLSAVTDLQKYIVFPLGPLFI